MMTPRSFNGGGDIDGAYDLFFDAGHGKPDRFRIHIERDCPQAHFHGLFDGGQLENACAQDHDCFIG